MLSSEKLEKLSKGIKYLEEEIKITENKIKKARLEKMLESVNNNIDNIEDILFKFNLEK